METSRSQTAQPPDRPWPCSTGLAVVARDAPPSASSPRRTAHTRSRASPASPCCSRRCAAAAPPPDRPSPPSAAAAAGTPRPSRTPWPVARDAPPTSPASPPARCAGRDHGRRLETRRATSRRPAPRTPRSSPRPRRSTRTTGTPATTLSGATPRPGRQLPSHCQQPPAPPDSHLLRIRSPPRNPSSSDQITSAGVNSGVRLI